MNIIKIIPILVASSLSFTAQAAEVKIVQKDKTYNPGEVSAKVGDTLSFENQDAVAHNVMSASEGNEFDLKKQAPGDPASVVIKKPASGNMMEVRCLIHPKMLLKVKVD